MFNFFKENKSLILKCFLNQIGMTVFGLIVLITSSMINSVLFHVLGVVAILTYLFLLYTILWEKGAEDKIRIEAGRIKENKLYGLFISLWANCINILFAFIIVITSFFVTEYDSFINNFNGVFTILFRFLNAMFLSLTSSVEKTTSFIYILVLLLPVVVCWISYILGIKGYRHIMPEKRRK